MIELREDEKLTWDMYFSSVVSMMFHPRTKLKHTLDECAEIADDMIEERRCRLPLD